MKRLLALFVCILLNSSLLQAQLETERLRLNDLQNPAGIGTVAPRFSWWLRSNKPNTLQSAYELRVYASDALSRSKILWESGKVVSDQSLRISYAGPALKSNQKYKWQVRIWDNLKRVSAWSDTAYWQMGLVNTADWQAVWIAPNELPDQAQKPACIFNKSFASTQNLYAATAYITAHGVYEATINGQRVGNAILPPGWTTYQKRLQYQAYDVTHLVKRGYNGLNVTVGQGWYEKVPSWSQEQSGGVWQPALLFQLMLEYEDGTVRLVSSDGSWKVTRGGPVRHADLYDGETYDARLASLDSVSWLPVQPAAHDFNNLVPTESELVTKQETLAAIKRIVTPKGEVVFDLGQNLTGWAQVRLQGRTGDTVKISHAETLDPTGNFYTDNLRGARQQNIFILDGKAQTYSPKFTFQGFRYIKIEGYGDSLNVESVKAVVLHSNMRVTGTFACSDSLVNRLQQNILWSQKGNFLDVPTDCPQRDERLGWTGDAQAFTQTAAFNYGVDLFFAKWLKDLAAEQFSNGLVPAVVPNVFGRYVAGSAGWGDAAVVVPWKLFQAYGDTAILRTQWKSMEAWGAYVAAQSKEHLWNSGFHFGDWLYYRSVDDWDTETATTNKFYIAQCFWAYSTSILQQAAVVLGKKSEALAYAGLLQKIKAAFLKEYITPNHRFVSGTQTAYVLALQFDMLPESMRAETVRKLAEDVVARGYHLSTGFLGTPYLCEVLSRFGHNDVAYKLLLQPTYPSWLYPLTKGATTMWERWDGIKPDGSFQGPMMNSFNHYSYGAVGSWLYQSVGGISPVGAGYKKIRFQPMPDSLLQYAAASLETPYGLAGCRWKRVEDSIAIQITVPPNTTAEMVLPEPVVIEVPGAKLKNTPANSGVKIYAIGSGTYAFSYKEK